MNEQKEYKARIADLMLHNQLEAAGAVLIQGPKWCGKTTTAEQAAKSILYMDQPSRLAANLMLAENEPEILLEGETPRLIDEWQLAPQLWDAARFVVSHRGKTGQFVFTGSSVPPDQSKITHTGTGRFAWLTMRPMSLWESGESNGNVSLGRLFEGGKLKTAISPELSLSALSEILCRGGWPGSLYLSPQAALRQTVNYVEAICHSDISRVDGVNRDAGFARRLLRSYARHQGTQAPLRTLYADLSAGQEGAMSEETISSYLAALRKIFVIEEMPAWNPNLRSRTAIRTSDTRYFIDPSIASAALGLGPKDLMGDLNTFGLLFEAMAIRDLRVYADALDGEVFHYRDANGLECDAVVHLRNGRYGLVEIKLGGERLEAEGAATLKKLASKIDTSKMQEPSFMMVLTAVGAYAYQRPDGVSVVPISCLKD
ncbi:MAG: ATP-binding protein [Prevotella sp.]|nr:ATP-binding protein [Prevotella sp.]